MLSFNMSRLTSFVPSHPLADRPSHRRLPSTSRSSQISQRLPSLRHPLFHAFGVLVLLLSSAVLNQGRSTGGTAKRQSNDSCATYDLPNPLAEAFPNAATGVLNATLVIIPIPLEEARRLIPSEYDILERAYRDLVPDFPEGMYPVMVQAAHDHDVQFRAYNLSVADFSRAGFEFPFLDLLGDGYSSFRWAPAQLITANHKIAIDGSQQYGTLVTPAQYHPPCDAYSWEGSDADTMTFFTAGSVNSSEFVAVHMTRGQIPDEPAVTYPLDLFANITNQPTFADGSTCDNMIRPFNTSMSRGKYAPVVVQGRVTGKLFPYGEDDSLGIWDGVWGIQIATPFIENNYLSCEQMKGYDGSDAPDMSPF